MKSFKFLGIAVATLGIAASVGGAIALYTKPATDIGFGIGAGTYSGSSGTVTYKINGNTSGSVLPKYFSTGDTPTEGPGLSATYSQVKYEFPLSATLSNDIPAQNFVHGNLGVSITNIPTKYQGKLTIWAGIEGYTEGKQGENLYHDTYGGDFNITNEATSYVKERDVSIETSGDNKLVVWMKYTIDPATDYIALDEEALGYTLSVTWGAPTHERAYIVGTGNGWAIHDDFAMAINLNADLNKTEWTFNNFAADASWTGAKCITDANPNVWSAGDDAALENGKTYDIYWEGTNEAQAWFTPQTA